MPGVRPLHRKHGQRKLADMEPSAPPAPVVPGRALGLMALLVAAAGLVLCFAEARQVGPADRGWALGDCDRPVELRPHAAQGRWHRLGEVGDLVCADALDLPESVQLEAGDAWVQEPGGAWSRRPQQMAAPLRLLVDLPLHLNRATAQELALLGGLNARQARAIVAHRERMGPFGTIEALAAVHGVGRKTVAKVAPFLQVASGHSPGATGAAAAKDANTTRAPPPRQSCAPSFAKESFVRREWLVDVVARLPQATLSRAWGWLARRRRPKMLVRLYQRAFVSAVGIDMAEAEHPLQAYPSLQDLFVRKLKAGLRPVDAHPAAVVSPVDGRVGHCGVVEAGTLLQVKGRSYSLARLLGDAEKAKAFEGGAYATFYLAPRDYHRIHAPIAGHVAAARLIPGSLFPVFEESLHKVDELFARNERIVTYLRGQAAGDGAGAGELAVIKVAATLVGCITVAYDPSLRGNVRGAKERLVGYAPAPPVAKGDLLGAFELGSTVVLIGEPGKLVLADLSFGQHVHVGQRIGTLPQVAEQVGSSPVAPAVPATVPRAP